MLCSFATDNTCLWDSFLRDRMKLISSNLSEIAFPVLVFNIINKNLIILLITKNLININILQTIIKALLNKRVRDIMRII